MSLLLGLIKNPPTTLNRLMRLIFLKNKEFESTHATHVFKNNDYESTLATHLKNNNDYESTHATFFFKTTMNRLRRLLTRIGATSATASYGLCIEIEMCL